MMLFPKALFLATAFQQLLKIQFFFLIFIKNFQIFLRNFQNIWIFRLNAQNINAGF